MRAGDNVAGRGLGDGCAGNRPLIRWSNGGAIHGFQKLLAMSQRAEPDGLASCGILNLALNHRNGSPIYFPLFGG